MTELLCAGKTIDLDNPAVMGILNVTPDSFSDGGQHNALDAAVSRAQQMVEEGALLIDIGGESTRPGASPVDADEESRRVVPVIDALMQHDLPAVISVDTSKPLVMQRAVEAGAGMINDVLALRVADAVETVAALKVPVCLMHMQGEPRTMQQAPQYDDVVTEVFDFLQQRLSVCRQAGVASDQLLVDPGFGFGKTLAHNLQLLHELHRFKQLGVPVLAGLSRKSMIGMILDKPVEQRLYGSIATACLAYLGGASIIRVHDVAPTMDALKVCRAVQQA